MLARSTIRGPHALALRAFRRMPTWARVFIVRRVAPAHTVGALCFVEHEGRVLVLRQRHRRGWTLPGGLVNRGETAVQAVEREVGEETGLAIAVGQPFATGIEAGGGGGGGAARRPGVRTAGGQPFATVIEPRVRRVDVLFHVRVTERPEVTVA